MKYDYHTHSNYSDGVFLFRMIKKAKELDLKGIGFADHCNVSKRKSEIERKKIQGFNLDKTYKRRKEAIQQLRKRHDIKIYNAVEIDYDPRDEKPIKTFQEKTNFDYSLGSAHIINGTHIQNTHKTSKMTKKQRRKMVSKYLENMEKLVDSNLFDVIAHIDVYKRNKHLRKFEPKEKIENLVTAVEENHAIPEINLGRSTRGMKDIHPTNTFIEKMKSKDIKFITGTDSHTPDSLGKNVGYYREKIHEEDWEITSLNI